MPVLHRGILSPNTYPFFRIPSNSYWHIFSGAGHLAINTPGRFATLIVLLAIYAIIAAIIPLLGRLHSFSVLVTGAITLIFVVASLKASHPDAIREDITFVPSLWFVIGILFIGGIADLLGLVVVMATMAFGEDWGGLLMMMRVDDVPGFIPLFIYGAWLGTQMGQGH